MWRALDETCRRGVSEGVSPGIVLLAGRREEVLFHRAYGCRALEPARLPMTPDTVFDLSSLTKPVATATAMMLLVRDGRVRLDDPVCTVIPEFSQGAKPAVTFRQLLNHTSGLPAWKPYYETVMPVEAGAMPETVMPMNTGAMSETVMAVNTGTTAESVIPVNADAMPESVIPAKAGIQKRHGRTLDSGFRRNDESDPDAAARKTRCHEQVHDEELVARPGERFLYSDLGFMLLGEAVERLSGKPLDRFCEDEMFTPMQLSSTFFVDLSRSSEETCPAPAPAIAAAEIAATEDCPWRRKILCGEVHDDNAYAMGGIAGHAGLFSSAPDVHRFIRFLGRCRAGAEPDFLPAAVVREFLEAERPLPGQTHVLGWDTPSPEGSSSGRHFSSRTVGHLGFTGTSIWWDLERDVHVVFLTNRVHPSRDNDAIRQFRPLVHDAVMEALGS